MSLIRGVVLITRVADNVTREHIHMYAPEEEDVVRFLFEEGNYACDCNRELFFCEAVGEQRPNEPGCGDTRFTVDLTYLKGKP